MAARKHSITHDREVRERIRSSQLVNRLINFASGKNDPATKKPIEMSPAQVTAALGLLKKALPDLSAMELSGEVDNRVHIVSDEPLTDDEWTKRYGNGSGVAAPAGPSKSTH